MIKDIYTTLLYIAICVYAAAFLLHAAAVLIQPVIPIITAFLVISALAWFFIWRRR